MREMERGNTKRGQRRAPEKGGGVLRGGGNGEKRGDIRSLMEKTEAQGDPVGGKAAEINLKILDRKRKQEKGEITRGEQLQNFIFDMKSRGI